MGQLIGFPFGGVTTHKNNRKILTIRRLVFSQMCFVFNTADLVIYFFACVCACACVYVGPIILLFWTFGDVCPGFQSQYGLPCLCA